MIADDLMFTESDFDSYDDCHGITLLANRILLEKLEKAPEVFGCDVGTYSEQWGAKQGKSDTHRACLINIKEIK